MLRTQLRAKLETLVWYAKRPTFYPDAIRRLLLGQITTPATHRKRAVEKEQGRAWCVERASSADGMCQALGVALPVQAVSELYPDVWQRAHETIAACPVKMGGPANVDLLFHLVRHLKARAVIETGVASGWSSLAILLAMQENGEGKLVSIDMPYPKLNNEAYVGCAVPAQLRSRWKLVRRSDRAALPGCLRELSRVQLAHYDSDKSVSGRRFAYPLLWSHLDAGGMLVSDDIEDNLGFAEFCASVNRKPWVIEKKPGNYVGFLLK